MEGNGIGQWGKCSYGVQGTGIRMLVCEGHDIQQKRIQSWQSTA